MRLLIAVFISILFVVFFWLSRAKVPDYQASEFEYVGPFNNWVILMCENADIDSNGYWSIGCPECPRGTEGRGCTEKTKDGWWLRNFRTAWLPAIDELKPGEEIEIRCGGGQLYCDNCFYPIGTDWEIVDGVVVTDPNLDKVMLYGIRIEDSAQ